MTLATLKGRLQTKLVTFLIVAAVTVVFSVMDSMVYLPLFSIAVVVGLLLETLWGLLMIHQPGWVTFLLGAIEFLVITWIAIFLHLPLTVHAALTYYLAAWIPIQLFLIYLMPVWSTQWADEGRELW